MQITHEIIIITIRIIKIRKKKYKGYCTFLSIKKYNDWVWKLLHITQAMGSKAVSSEKLKFAAKSFVPGIKLAHLPDFYSSYIHAHTYIQSSVIQDTTNIFTFSCSLQMLFKTVWSSTTMYSHYLNQNSWSSHQEHQKNSWRSGELMKLGHKCWMKWMNQRNTTGTERAATGLQSPHLLLTCLSWGISCTHIHTDTMCAHCMWTSSRVVKKGQNSRDRGGGK